MTPCADHDEGTKEKVIAAKEMLASKFCYAPYGGTTGYSGRYLNALLFGCVPVFWVSPYKALRRFMEAFLGYIKRSIWAR